MAVAEAASVPMIALRIAVAALMVGAAPLASNAQDRLPVVGAVPEDWAEYGRVLVAAKRHREAIAAFERAMQERKPGSARNAFSIACAYAELGNRKQTMRWVEHAIDLGFEDRESIRRAPEFTRFREDPKLDQLLREVAISKLRVAVVTQEF